MVGNTLKIIDTLKQNTDKAILFHSATGKDSIVMIDLLTKHNIEITPVFMYRVKGLEFIEKYISYFEKKYNVNFIQVPHYSVSSYIKYGMYGIKKNEKQPIVKLMDINKSICDQTGVDWSVLGFKKADGMNRRIMLNELELSAFQFKTKKCYPLSDWSNKDCLAYIYKNKLVNPLIVNKNKPSQDIEFEDKYFLFWLEKNYPGDLRKIYEIYPEVEALLYSFKNETNK